MRVRHCLVATLAVASVVFVGLELRDGWREISGEQLPGIGPLLGAAGLLVIGQIAIGEAMAALSASGTSRAERRWAFHLTQPAKYVPAGVAQAAGVVVALGGRGARRADAVIVWLVHTGSLVVAGVAVGLVLSPAFDWPALLVVVGFALPLLVNRKVLRAVLARVGRFVGVGEPNVPIQPELFACVGLALLGVALHGGGFAVLVEGAGLEVGFLEAMAAYPLAFGISVATPLPGGLGAREAIVFGVLAAAEAALIVPLVLVRLLLVGIELALFVGVRRPSRP